MTSILMIAQTVYARDPRVRRHTLALTRAGYAVDVICQTDRPHSRILRDTADGATLYFIPIQKRRGGKLRYALEYVAFGLAAFLLAARLRARRRYKVVYVNTMPDVLVFAALIPKLLGARVILDVHDPFPELMTARFGFPPRHPLVRGAVIAERLSLRFADKVITVHSAMQQLLARSMRPSDIAIIMNLAASDQPHIAPLTPPLGRFVIIYAGTISEHYGLDIALDALHHVRRAVPNVLLRIVGNGGYASTLQARVAVEGLGDYVEFVGTVPLEQVPLVLAQAHCGICPVTGAFWDRILFPNKIYEYIASGLPAVIPRTALFAAYYPETAVVYYRPDDAEDFAAKLIAVYKGGDTLRVALAAERDTVLSRMNWPDQERRLLRYVADAAAG